MSSDRRSDLSDQAHGAKSANSGSAGPSFNNLCVIRLLKTINSEQEEDMAIIKLLGRDLERGLELSQSTRCPYCGSKATYLKILGVYYCFNCKKYV